MLKRKDDSSKKTPVKKKAGKKKATKKTATASSGSSKTTVKRRSASKGSTTKKTATRSATKRSAALAPAGYSGMPLIKKLGIKPGTTLTLLGEPPDFLKTLGGLPDKLKIRKTALGDRDLTIWFPRNAAELKKRIESIANDVNDGGLWIAWPKKSSGVKTDLTQDMVRELGLKQGVVDYKICAIDETYSGLKFAKRSK